MPNSRGLGGSGTRWNIPSGIGERLRALEPVDFESRDWLPRSGWPSDYAELKSYYACAAALCGIEPEQSSSEECARRDGIGLCLSILIPLKPRFSITPASVWWDQEMVSWLSQTEIKALVHGTL